MNQEVSSCLRIYEECAGKYSRMREPLQIDLQGIDTTSGMPPVARGSSKIKSVLKGLLAFATTGSPGTVQVDAKAWSGRFEALLGPYNTAKYHGNEGGRGRKLTLASGGHHVLVHVHSLVLGVARHFQKRRILKLPNSVSLGQIPSRSLRATSS